MDMVIVKILKYTRNYIRNSKPKTIIDKRGSQNLQIGFYSIYFYNY